MLNEYYWGIQSDSRNCRYVGSYGRGTAIKGFSDVDIIVKLPLSEYHRFTNYQYNGQSSLLQHVKRAISDTYSTTSTKGDGQVVVVEFSDGVKFEIVPSFEIDGGIIYPDANKKGEWKRCDPVKEIEAINIVNKATQGAVKEICRLARGWKMANNIEISGILIDDLAIDFSIKHIKDTFHTLEVQFGFYLLHLAKQREVNYWVLYGSGDVINRDKYTFEDKALEAAGEVLKIINTADIESKRFFSEKLFGKVVNEVFI